MANTTINVIVANVPSINITTNAISGIITTNNPVTLKNIPTLQAISNAVASTTIDTLLDVDLTQRVDGSTLVYNANTNTYDVEPLTIDGGTF